MPGAILGGDAARFEARLARLTGPQLPASVGKALVEGAEVIRADAVASLDDGAILGKGHVASAPGEPPNSDTRKLAESGTVLELTEESGVIATGVQFGDDEVIYAGWQEFGNSRLAERPYLRPAVARGRQGVLNGVRDAVNKTISGV